MILVFDIGATTSRLALADGESLVSTITFPTAQNLDEEVAQLREAARGLAKEGFNKAVGGVAGKLDAHHETLLRSPNLESWEGSPLAERFRDAFGVPVTLMNDAALAGLAEAVRGAGKGRRIVAYLTVSTGVGGCSIVDGRIEESADTFEPGEITTRDNLSLEECVGGNALQKRFGQPPATMMDAAVWAAVRADLAHGLMSLIERWSPDIFVLGGGLVLHEKFDLAALSADIIKIRPTLAVPPIVKTALGDAAGLVGAQVYATR